MVQDWDV
ncbi:unnamed protein product, partial [Rotaria sp. Silwood1]